MRRTYWRVRRSNARTEEHRSTPGCAAIVGRVVTAPRSTGWNIDSDGWMGRRLEADGVVARNGCCECCELEGCLAVAGLVTLN